ncbi:hypothetical protein QE320_gp046 [Pseudomonas phage EM]|uniref:Uncharacterized protein n=1 Tax=Pseudomonas phage EM TaxID=2936914 RepID=A0AAE9HI57_9CAUD|nr:hypothetical protein QE320_gp046 [Pseudomonas phage EM]UPW35848.1 hypothetical protein EM_046 [Pseudomonas phage EM]
MIEIWELILEEAYEADERLGMWSVNPPSEAQLRTVIKASGVLEDVLLDEVPKILLEDEVFRYRGGKRNMCLYKIPVDAGKGGKNV